MKTNRCQPLQKLIQLLKKPLKDIDPSLFSQVNHSLPLIYVSHESQILESDKAEQLNTALALEDQQARFTADEVVLSYSPLRSIMKKYENQLVILNTSRDAESMAHELGLKKYITIEEYAALYSAQAPQVRGPAEGPIAGEMRKKIGDRLNISDPEVFKESLVVHAVFILDVPKSWYEYMQILTDLLTTPDGKVAKQIPKLSSTTDHIPVYCANNEMVFYTDYKLPRIGFRAFNEVVKHMYKESYNGELKIQFFGRPSEIAYKHIEKCLKEKAGDNISNIYVIVHDLNEEIKEVKKLGWKPILVRSKSSESAKEDSDNKEYSTEYVVNDIYEAVQLVFRLEGIK